MCYTLDRMRQKKTNKARSYRQSYAFQACLEKQLLAAIKRSGISMYRLAKNSGVSEPVLSRFISGQRDITLTTASKITEALGLVLMPKKRR